MPIDRRWLLAPPALALLLFAGPLEDLGRSAGSAPAAKTLERTEPGETDDPIGSSGLVATGAVLLAAAFVVAVLAHARRRGAGPARPGLLQRRDTLRLSPRATLHVLEFEGGLLLVGDTAAGLAVLARHPDPNLPGTPAPSEPEIDDGVELRDTASLRERVVTLPRPDGTRTGAAFRSLLRQTEHSGAPR